MEYLLKFYILLWIADHHRANLTRNIATQLPQLFAQRRLRPQHQQRPLRRRAESGSLSAETEIVRSADGIGEQRSATGRRTRPGRGSESRRSTRRSVSCDRCCRHCRPTKNSPRLRFCVWRSATSRFSITCSNSASHAHRTACRLIVLRSFQSGL